MEPVFVLSYPRSRTAWLATYLNGLGVFAFHEAWREVATVKALRKLMESKGGGPVANVDSSNWFFLDDLQKEFPTAKYLIIEREWIQVAKELNQVFGPHDWTSLLAAYQKVMRRVDGFTVSFEGWTPEVSLLMVRYLAPKAKIDLDYHRMMHRFLIRVTQQDVVELLGLAGAGKLEHLTARMTGA